MKRSLNISDIIFLILICTLTVGFGVAIFLLPQREFSDKENRALQGAPSTSLSSILEGDYFKALNGFYRDQFPLREEFTALYAASEKALGKTETNGVITNSDGICVALPQYTGIERSQKNLSAISSLKKIGDVHLYVPPSSFEVFDEALPTFYPQDSETAKLLDKDSLEDFLTLTKIASEEYYYKTDHHWTTKGAYFAYTQICDRIGIEAYGEEYFVKVDVCDDFRGTSAARSGLPNWLISEDSITLYRYNGDDEITIENHETQRITKGFYNYGALSASDKYKIFLSGNYSHLSIRGNGERPTLLLIKDSFANSVIPFLSLHFDIEVIDPRYCTKEQLRSQLERNDIDITLILMGFETFTTNIFN